MKRLALVVPLAVLLAAPLAAQAPPPPPPVGTVIPAADVPMHDPVMIRANGVTYIFATGRGIAVWSSTDLAHWRREAPVFAEPPAWTVAAVPTFRGFFWAPDISFHDGQYYLYYAVSAFGKNTSAIGVATNVTLDPRAPDFQWVDRGEVIRSVPGQTNWNAIDPNLVTDAAGVPWLDFGSFWGGIKLAQLTPDRLHVAGPVDDLPTIASRMKNPEAPNPPALAGLPVDAGGNAIEGPFIYKRGGHYYLFCSIDYCCRGAASTYKMIVGRADRVTGPYVDEDGAPLARGGGRILLAGDARWHGVGHCGVYDFDGTTWLIFHGYDATDHGLPKLRLEKITWTDAGWPRVAIPKS